MNSTFEARHFSALGLANYLLPKAEGCRTVNIKTKIRCLVLENPQTEGVCTSKKSLDFLLKMLGAIGLDTTEVAYCECNKTQVKKTLEKYETIVVLLLGGGFKPEQENQFCLPHPSDIFQNENLKREAWESLKKVKEWLI
jgi:hypothetical protein